MAMQMMKETLAELVRVYEAAVSTLKADITAFVEHGTLPPSDRRENRLWTYPELRITYRGTERAARASRAFGRLEVPGTYATTVTRPHLFADYLADQLSLIEAEYEVEFTVTPSAQEIPFPYVLEGVPVGAVTPQELATHFPSTDLAMIGDEIADGIHIFAHDVPQPLALFAGLRTDSI